MNRQKFYYIFGLVFLFLLLALVGGWLFWQKNYGNVKVIIINNAKNKLSYNLPSNIPNLGNKEPSIYAVLTDADGDITQVDVTLSNETNCVSQSCVIGSILAVANTVVSYDTPTWELHQSVHGVYAAKGTLHQDRSVLTIKDRNGKLYELSTTDNQPSHLMALANALIDANKALFQNTSYANANWQTYTNQELGFSVKLPTDFPSRPKCESETINGTTYYAEKDSNEKNSFTIVTVQDKVYIQWLYYAATSLPTQIGNDSLYASCSIKTLTQDSIIQGLKQPGVVDDWDYKIDPVSNDTELNALIQKTYGSGGCSLGEKTPTDEPGVYNVTIKGDGKTWPDTSCFINYVYGIKYYSLQHKVVLSNASQGLKYASSDQMFFDTGIADSFKLLD